MKVNLADNTQYKEQIKELWRYAFSDSEAFLSMYFGRLWQGKNAVAVLEDKKVIGALELVPYRLSLRGTPIDASYVVGVSTAPEARGRGVAAALMRGAMEKQLGRREVLSLLQPFSYEFYSKMGYATCYCEASCRVPAAHFPALRYNGQFFRASLRDQNKLTKVYEAFCRGKNGFVCRGQEEWRFIFEFLTLTDGYLYAYQDETGAVTAYLSFIKKADRFRVLEAAYADANGLKALMSFTASHFSTYSHIDLLLPADSPVPSLFREPPVCERRPMVMARILDISRALSAGLGGLRLGITDDFCPENTGVYEENGGGIVRYDSRDCDVSTDIGGLTQLVMGFMSAGELWLTGRLVASEDAVFHLDRLYPKQQNYINHILTANV